MPELWFGSRHRLDAGVGRVSRLNRFEEHRFIGDRRTMKVYDCDDPEQFAVLDQMVSQDGLWERNELQTFAPDELAEARNRSFSTIR